MVVLIANRAPGSAVIEQVRPPGSRWRRRSSRQDRWWTRVFHRHPCQARRRSSPPHLVQVGDRLIRRLQQHRLEPARPKKQQCVARAWRTRLLQRPAPGEPMLGVTAQVEPHAPAGGGREQLPAPEDTARRRPLAEGLHQAGCPGSAPSSFHCWRAVLRSSRAAGCWLANGSSSGPAIRPRQGGASKEEGLKLRIKMRPLISNVWENSRVAQSGKGVINPCWWSLKWLFAGASLAPRARAIPATSVTQDRTERPLALRHG